MTRGLNTVDVPGQYSRYVNFRYVVAYALTKRAQAPTANSVSPRVWLLFSLSLSLFVSVSVSIYPAVAISVSPSSLVVAATDTVAAAAALLHQTTMKPSAEIESPLVI